MRPRLPRVPRPRPRPQRAQRSPHAHPDLAIHLDFVLLALVRDELVHERVEPLVLAAGKRARVLRRPTKHRQQSMGAPDIPAFLGGRRKSDRCPYVSTGGLTKEARYEAERAETSVTLVDIVRLRQLVVDLCDRLDPETRSLVPLRHLYRPAASVAPRR